MEQYIIKGGKRAEGEVTISGSKNAALPIIAASILNAGKTTLYNVPNIHDTQMMFEILKKLGGKVTKKNNKIIIETNKINKYEMCIRDRHRTGAKEWGGKLDTLIDNQPESTKV